MQRKYKYLTYRFKWHTVSETKFVSTRRSRPNPILYRTCNRQTEYNYYEKVFKIEIFKKFIN